ncbi:MAG: alpha/beta fold hydrolase [Gemmatimonadetes bacterium]|nr:alpha/beta fold hydrolase [Gemmatimonadota bacterium]
MTAARLATIPAARPAWTSLTLLAPVVALVLHASIGPRPRPAAAAGAAGPLSTSPSATAAGPQSIVREAFVLLRGSDTLAVERFSRTAERLEGELVDFATNDQRESYVAVLRPDGLVSHLQVAVRPVTMARDTPPVRRAGLTFGPAATVSDVRDRAGERHQRLATPPGTLPYLKLSFALLEQATIRARAIGDRRVELPLVEVGGGRTFAALVERVGADSLTLRVDGREVRARVTENGRILGARIPPEDLLVERVLPHEAGILGRADYSAPAGAPYLAEEVRVRARDAHSLAGTLTLPAGASSPHPAVILVTGSGPQERDAAYLGTYRPFRQLADTLSRRGIAVLRLDDRGVGASTGSFTNATSADFAEDVRAALAFLRGRADLDGERIGLLGESEGGLIASMVAATDPGLRGVVLMGTPSRSGRSLIASQVRYRLGRDSDASLTRQDSLVDAVEARNDSLARLLPWLAYILDYDPIPTAVRVSPPVLILQGETDRQVPPTQAGELAIAVRGGGNRDVTVRIFPHLNHLFLVDEDGDPERYAGLASKALPPQVLGTVADWFEQRLRPPPPAAEARSGAGAAAGRT